MGGAWLQVWPFPSDHPLELIAVRRPAVYAGFLYGYVTVWFTTPFLLIKIVGSFAYIFFLARADRAVRRSALPPYPRPEQRDDLFLILGEQHRRTSGRRPPSRAG